MLVDYLKATILAGKNFSVLMVCCIWQVLIKRLVMFFGT